MKRQELLRITGCTVKAFETYAYRGFLPFLIKDSRWSDYSLLDACLLRVLMEAQKATSTANAAMLARSISCAGWDYAGLIGARPDVHVVIGDIEGVGIELDRPIKTVRESEWPAMVLVINASRIARAINDASANADAALDVVVLPPPPHPL